VPQCDLITRPSKIRISTAKAGACIVGITAVAALTALLVLKPQDLPNFTRRFGPGKSRS
jgi:hypothetical protein